MNPHKRNAYKILSLARLPVPTLPHIAFLRDYFVSPSRQILVYQSSTILSTTFFTVFTVNAEDGNLNPHKRNAYKILSLARLPVPTLPHIAFLWDYFVSPSRRIVVYQNQQTKSIPFLYFFIFRKCFAFSQYLSQFSSAIRLTAT